MRGMIVSRLSRRAFFAATASVAFAVALGSVPSRADDQDSGQAEWPQSYEASPHMAVGREATPILSPATVEATEAAIQKYQDLVSRGGWNTVPGGAELRVGSKSKAVEALRERLVASGDLDPVAGAGPVFDSFVEAAVKRFQARNGLSQTGVVNEATFTELNVPATARLQQLQTNIVRLKAIQRRSWISFRGGEHSRRLGRDRRRRGRLFSPRRRRGQDRSPVADHADQGDRDQFQSVLDRAAFADQEGPDPEDEGRSELSRRTKRSASSTRTDKRFLRPRSTGTATRRPTSNTGRTRAPTSTRSGSSASTFPTPTAFTCMIRRRRASSATTSASYRPAASGCRMCAIMSRGF